MSYRDWYVGMKVVCVDAVWRGPGYQADKGIPCPLTVGDVYEIEDIFPARRTYPNPAPIDVLLRGVRKAQVYGDIGSPANHTFNARRFRPVQPRKTDISCFTAMLNGAPMQKELS